MRIIELTQVSDGGGKRGQFAQEGVRIGESWLKICCTKRHRTSAPFKLESNLNVFTANVGAVPCGYILMTGDTQQNGCLSV